jgi:hypothetical protein
MGLLRMVWSLMRTLFAGRTALDGREPGVTPPTGCATAICETPEAQQARQSPLRVAVQALVRLEVMALERKIARFPPLFT